MSISISDATTTDHQMMEESSIRLCTFALIASTSVVKVR